jgi:hypothetical protein
MALESAPEMKTSRQLWDCVAPNCLLVEDRIAVGYPRPAP